MTVSRKPCENIMDKKMLLVFSTMISFLLNINISISTLGSNMTFIEPDSSVYSVQDLRTGDRWFNPWLGQYSLFLSQLSNVSAMGMWESSQWLGKKIVLVKRPPEKHE